MINLYFSAALVYFVTLMVFNFSRQRSRDAFFNNIDATIARYGKIAAFFMVMTGLVCSFLFWPIEGIMLIVVLYKKYLNARS